jgi:hypothetical protein
MHDLEIELTEEDVFVDRILKFTAGHPNVIQRLCQHLVMRINRNHRLRLSIEDVESVIANNDFLRNDFLDTYWGQATLLERLCTLVMAKQQDIHTLVDIHAALSDLAPDATLGDVNEALEGLVNLRNLLQRTPQGYTFAVKGFPKAIAQTYELDDLTALTCEKYRQAKRSPDQTKIFKNHQSADQNGAGSFAKQGKTPSKSFFSLFSFGKKQKKGLNE